MKPAGFLSLAAGALALAAAIGAAAQPYPAKPVRGLVAYGTGGVIDQLARILGAKLSERWAQPVVIENRVGANGNIGTEAAVKSPPDGYTVYFAVQPVAINRVVFPSAAFDPLRDLAPVSLIAMADFILVVHPTIPANTAREMIDYVKANPGKLKYGATSIQGEFVMELFKSMAGIDVEKIPYNAVGPLMNDLLAGRLHTYFTPPAVVVGHVASGKLRGLAVSSDKPIPVFPGVPTIKTLLPNLEVSTWYAVFVPLKTPADVISKLQADLGWALGQADVRERFEKLGTEPRSSSAEQLRTIMQKDVERAEDLVRRGVIKVSN